MIRENFIILIKRKKTYKAQTSGKVERGMKEILQYFYLEQKNHHSQQLEKSIKQNNTQQRN